MPLDDTLTLELCLFTYDMISVSGERVWCVKLEESTIIAMLSHELFFYKVVCVCVIACGKLLKRLVVLATV